MLTISGCYKFFLKMSARIHPWPYIRCQSDVSKEAKAGFPFFRVAARLLGSYKKMAIWTLRLVDMVAPRVTVVKFGLWAIPPRTHPISSDLRS